eukprot:c21852_g1_i4 orf=402-2738(+)
MPHSHRVRNTVLDGKSSSLVRAPKVPADNERYSARCGNGYRRFGGRPPSSYFNNTISSSAINSAKEESQGSSNSSLKCSTNLGARTAAQNVMLGSSDESGSDFDIEVGERDVSGSSAGIGPSDWVNSASSSVDELSSGKGDILEVKGGVSIRHKGQDVAPVGWRDRYVSQPARLYGSTSKSFIVDQGRSHGMPITGQSQRSLRKGSSSKAPQTDDLTAPLLLDRKAKPITDRIFQGESEGPAPVNVAPFTSKNRNVSNFTRRINQSTVNAGELQSRRKNSSQAFYSHRMRSDDLGAGYRDANSNGPGPSRRSLSTLVCSSAADVLPSVSSSALSNFACSSAADVLPSVSSSLANATNSFRPRKNSRAYGLLEEGETARGMQSVKRQVEDGGVFGTRETMDSRNGQSQDQVFRGSDLGVPRSMRSSFNHQRRPDPLKADSVTRDSSSSSTGIQPPRPNHSLWGSNVTLSRNGDGLGSFSRSNNLYPESNPAFGDELSNQWSLRRRSLYGSRDELMGTDNRISSRNLSYVRPANNTWSALHETHYTQSSFSGPPTRPPPLPPLAVFAEPSASQGGFPTSPPILSADFPFTSRSTSFVLPNQDAEGSAAAMAEAASFNPPTSSGETRPRLTVEGLSEILSALEYIERDEELSYEQILMLEATILLGGIGLHDRYRDMRIDIDNMSYEELLALEERIGNVNTGLSEDSVVKCVQTESFTSPRTNCGYVPQDIEIKCSICQEEFEEAVELGVLECGHSHHIDCIKQWLLQKNQCPICKAPAVT